MNEDIEYRWRCLNSVSDSILSECSDLFSQHYGTWSLTSTKEGNISLTPSRLRELLRSEGASVSLAYCRNILVGHAFSLRQLIEPFGYISWVTQLVVHTDYRRRGIGTKLLNSVWAFSNDYAWGLVTANPFTVRALEKSTRRRCRPSEIHKNLNVLNLASRPIPYTNDAQIYVDKSRSIINTKFEIDHSYLPKMVRQVTPPKWYLGNLNEGEEWLAFTFKTQRRRKITCAEICGIFQQSEQILCEAYSRMHLDFSHKWATHAEYEVEFITRELSVTTGMNLIDFGCGKGRHSLILGQKGIKVTGVDYLEPFIQHAKDLRTTLNISNVEFICGDCRKINLNQQYDIAICLYDVIGSYADESENDRILENLVNHLKPGGLVLISVMNQELTKARAKNKGDVLKDPDLLQRLKPSNIMQSTGDVFDPDYYLLDVSSGIVYRKEQFSEDGLLSAEHVVRDRRYSVEQMEYMCAKYGLTH